ncbi:MAG: VapC toxin family PIN domain ribonuclease [Cyclobacterium sp.]|nr:VapC toxin family PIN domain ribonuclease [Cyclobacterium sp.]
MFLFDTNICIYHIKGKYFLQDKFERVARESRFISEITLAELKFGIHNSQNPSANAKVLNDFLSGVNILPISPTLDFYAEEKARLRKLGTPIDEFDLLIGACAVVNDLCLVTNNESHFSRIKGIKIENWVK